MILWIDTETTGKLVADAPFGDPRQPHIVQIAAVLTDDEGERMASLVTLIKPDNWTIPTEATAIHSITVEKCEKYGMYIEDALDTVGEWAFISQLIGGHNVDFDIRMLCCEFARYGGNEFDLKIQDTPTFCTMLESTKICKLPGRFGNYKWPKLSEAYRHFFGRDLVGAHDALADIQATIDIWKAIKAAKTEPVAAAEEIDHEAL